MVEELKEHLLHKPFQPFQIVLRSGERLDVTKFGQVGIGLTRFMYVSPDYRRKVELKLDQIISLEARNAASAP